MKFSAFSTINFNEKNDFQVKTSDFRVIVPVGKYITVFNVDEDYNMPATATVTNVRTGRVYTCQNNAQPLCGCFQCIFPQVPIAVYVMKITINSITYTSEPFNVVKYNKDVCGCVSSTNEPLFDGTISIYASREYCFYHYFLRNNLEIKTKENEVFYNDEAGKAFSLENKSYIYMNVAGYACEHTTNAINVLASCDFFGITYTSSKTYNYLLKKVGEFSVEKLQTDVKSFNCDFNFDAVSQLARRIFSNLGQVTVTPAVGTVAKIPDTAMTLAYSNISGIDENDNYFQFDLAQNLTSINFHDIVKIPDNFMQAVVVNNTIPFSCGSIIHKLNKIGNNVCLSFTNTVTCKFNYLNEIGENVTIKKISGGINFTDNQTFNNFRTDKNNVYAKKATLINCVSNNFLFTPITKIENCELSASNLSNLASDCIIDNCILTSISYTLSGSFVFENCSFAENLATSNITLNLSGFSGSIENSFNGNFLTLAIVNGSNPIYAIDNETFNAEKVTENTPYILGLVERGNRIALLTPSTSTKFTRIGSNLIKTFDKNKLQSIEYQNITLEESESVSIVKIEEDTFNNVDFLGSIVDLRGLEFTNNFANDGINGNFTINATQLLKIQTLINIFNNFEYVNLNIYNDLPYGFDYQSFILSENILQSDGIIYSFLIHDDSNLLLVNRLRELYPDFSIQSYENLVNYFPFTQNGTCVITSVEPENNNVDFDEIAGIKDATDERWLKFPDSVDFSTVKRIKIQCRPFPTQQQALIFSGFSDSEFNIKLYYWYSNSLNRLKIEMGIGETPTSLTSWNTICYYTENHWDNIELILPDENETNLELIFNGISFSKTLLAGMPPMTLFSAFYVAGAEEVTSFNGNIRNLQFFNE